MKIQELIDILEDMKLETGNVKVVVRPEVLRKEIDGYYFTPAIAKGFLNEKEDYGLYCDRETAIDVYDIDSNDLQEVVVINQKTKK